MLAALKTWRARLTRWSRAETLTPSTIETALTFAAPRRFAGMRGMSGETLFVMSRPSNENSRVFTAGAPIRNAQALTPLENLCIMKSLDQDH